LVGIKPNLAPGVLIEVPFELHKVELLGSNPPCSLAGLSVLLHKEKCISY
jgi:hypothetical protein